MTTEYLRRNLDVARVIGASAGVKTALERLENTKNPKKWLIKQLNGVEARLVGLSKELAAWRDMAVDAPVYAAPQSAVNADLLAALKALIREGHSLTPSSKVWNDAHTAIAKATGGAA